MVYNLFCRFTANSFKAVFNSMYKMHFETVVVDNGSFCQINTLFAYSRYFHFLGFSVNFVCFWVENGENELLKWGFAC